MTLDLRDVPPIDDDALKKALEQLSRAMDTPREDFRQIAEKVTAAAAELAAAAQPKIDVQRLLDPIREVAKSMFEYARENLVFFKMLSNWHDLHPAPSDPGDEYEQEVLEPLRYISAAYTETHKGMKLNTEDDMPSLLPEVEEELAQLIRKFDRYHEEHPEASLMEAARDFADELFNGVGQTEIKSSEEFSIMVSKAARRQSDIAAQAQAGMLLDVGGKAEITVKIFGENGEPVTLGSEEKQIQDVLGDLIQKNGMPLNVTPAQILREWKGASGSEYVHESDVDHVREIMQRLMYTRCYIDYAQQAQKHKGVNRQADFEYDPAEAHLEGTLIAAKRASIKTTRGTADGYKIYDYPILYHYSHGFGQIGTFSKRLLRSASANGGNQKPQLRRYLLERLDVIGKTGKPIERATKRVGTIKIDQIANDFHAIYTPQSVRTLRKNVEMILDEWKTQNDDSHLLEWREVMTGRKITGWSVTVTAQEGKK